ncbi:MAG TPA: flavin-dependent monooxygenase [Rhodospirillales bacterium]|nr:flavin-dependent monooxygenase [Rhodospirillales bacterium]
MPGTFNCNECTPELMIERARGLVPLIREQAFEAETNRNISEEIIEKIREQGLFRLLQPKRFGGLEYDITTVVHCCLEWSSADASAAWVAGLGIVHQWLVALFPIKCQEEIWGDNTDAITFGSYAPSGTCKRVKNGFKISGTWSYASGCTHGDWALLGTLLPAEGANEPLRPGFVIIPATDYTIDTCWNPMGLAATGSHNVICDDVFLPEHRHITFEQLASGNAPGYQVLQSHLYRYPMLSLVAYSISTPAVGCLEGALRSFVQQTTLRETRGAVIGGGAKMAEYQSVQMRIGNAAGALKAAKAMLFEQLEETRQKVLERGETLTVRERLDNRLTQSYIIHLSLQGLEALWGAAGGAGIHRAEHLQRAWRDAHAISHHVSFNWDALMSMHGQYLLGLEPKGQY